MVFRIFARRYKTLRGESVYSEGEKSIADYLYTSRIQYEYETPIRLNRRRLVPDFFLPQYGIYIEYLGMINDPEYACAAQEKKITYYENNIHVIYIIPQHLSLIRPIIQQHIQYKSGRIGKTTYLQLIQNDVPKPINRAWVERRKRMIASAQPSTYQKILSTVLQKNPGSTPQKIYTQQFTKRKLT